MTSEHIHQFAQQLASWSHSIIELARLPFRRVETYPKISTDIGTIQPPLVFWINRQSLMAGGILLIPEQDIKLSLEQGKACAEALGLKHFVTWETQQVRIWEIAGDDLNEERCLPLQAPDQPDTFRYLLEDVLNALKLLAILGAVPPPQLAPQYFNNLFQITLEQTAPSLIEEYRKLRSEHDSFRAIDLDLQAHEANRLFLLKILALLLFDKHPEATQPEKLEETINQSIQYLPVELSSIFLKSKVPDAPQLPIEAAVGFHHLLMRLQQINWVGNSDKAVQSLNKLMQSWYGCVNSCSKGDVCIYPEAPQHRDFSACILSDKLPILAATGLFARAAQQQLPHLIQGSVFNYSSEYKVSELITARLLNQRGIAGSERQEIAIGLRRAWPSRRFTIRAGQPYWLWECIYLLGIVPLDTSLLLEIPIAALQAADDDIFWQIIREHFSITEIEKSTPDNVSILLNKSEENHDFCKIDSETGLRHLELYESRDFLRERILLALQLPEEIFSLIGKEILWNFELNPQSKGTDLFTRSTLYQLLKTILVVPGKKGKELPCAHIPIADGHYLKELELQFSKKANCYKPSDIDKVLADLFKCPLLQNLTIPRCNIPNIQQNVVTEISEEVGIQIRDLIGAHGRPDFPEQYLYFLDHPQLDKFRFTPPLKQKGNILGQFELEDATGKIIEGYGEELEQALLLCSALDKGKPELPTDRHQLTTLLEYYKKDLNSLYKTLEQECYSLIGNPQIAKKQIVKIWRELKLPDPSWFK